METQGLKRPAQRAATGWVACRPPCAHTGARPVRRTPRVARPSGARERTPTGLP
ncbi:hypothetical protein BSLA_02f3408 [Burkholderia stabilis]|nr:hypothetical protein BSLA_02f3408 [Burkholderia stabilis]